MGSKNDSTRPIAINREGAGGDDGDINLMEAQQCARTVLETLRVEASDECHSRQQHEYISSQRRAGIDEELPAYKKGSRIVDTAAYSIGLEKGLATQEPTDQFFIRKMLDALASTTPVLPEGGDAPAQALTARARDWLAPTETEDRFCFRRVRNVDRSGALVPANCCAIPVSGPTDISVGVVIDLPVQRLEYLRSMGVTYDVHRVAASSAEPLGRLRRRIGCLAGCSQCPPQCIRVYFQEQLMEDDRIPIVSLGIRDGSELTVLLEPSDDPFYTLPQSDAQILNVALARVMSVGLKIRAGEPKWTADYRSRRRTAQLALDKAVDQMKAEVQRQFRSYAGTWGKECAARACPSWSYDNADGAALRRTETATRAIIGHDGQSNEDEAPLTTAMRAMLSCLITGHRKVLECTEKLGGVSYCTDRQHAFAELTDAIENLRRVGDAVDVETRNLPVCWTLDLDWVVPPSGIRETTQCFMPGCGRTVFVDQLEEHTNGFHGPCSETGVVPADFDDGRQGTNMGGSLAIICDVSGAEIDPEDTQRWPTATGEELPFRSPRIHSIESGIDRSPMYHEIIEYLHRSAKHAVDEDVPGASAAVALAAAYDCHSGDTWVRDKQNIYWLHEYVKEGKNLGKQDTPASMALRAFDAFAERPSIAVPTEALVSDADLPRLTPRTILADSAKAVLTEVGGFLWLKYSDLGRIVRSVASGLASRLVPGSCVAIAGYNDFEWLCADLAATIAGMCVVGIHTTFKEQDNFDLKWVFCFFQINEILWAFTKLSAEIANSSLCRSLHRSKLEGSGRLREHQ